MGPSWFPALRELVMSIVKELLSIYCEISHHLPWEQAKRRRRLQRHLEGLPPDDHW